MLVTFLTELRCKLLIKVDVISCGFYLHSSLKGIKLVQIISYYLYHFVAVYYEKKIDIQCFTEMDEFNSYSIDGTNENGIDESNSNHESWSFEDDHISADDNDDDAESTDSYWSSYTMLSPEDDHPDGIEEADESNNHDWSSFTVFPPEDDHVGDNEADDDNVSVVYVDFCY